MDDNDMKKWNILFTEFDQYTLLKQIGKGGNRLNANLKEAHF